ncbi:MAG: S26 family signal peptidase [Blautia wexlerae]
MNIRKWKDSPALKETRDMLEIKLEDKKSRDILNWIFQIMVTARFCMQWSGLVMFQSVTVQESTMEPTLQVGERFFVNRAVYKVSSPERGDIIVYKTSGSDDAASAYRPCDRTSRERRYRFPMAAVLDQRRNI